MRTERQKIENSDLRNTVNREGENESMRRVWFRNEEEKRKLERQESVLRFMIDLEFGIEKKRRLLKDGMTRKKKSANKETLKGKTRNRS